MVQSSYPLAAIVLHQTEHWSHWCPASSSTSPEAETSGPSTSSNCWPAFLAPIEAKTAALMNVRYIVDLETMVCDSDKPKCQQTRMKCKSVEGWNKWVLYRIKVDDVLRPQCDYSYCDRINISNQRIRLHTSARVRRFFVSHRIMLSKLPTDVLHWHAGLQVDMNPTATQQHHMDGHWNWMSALSTPQRSNVAVSKVTIQSFDMRLKEGYLNHCALTVLSNMLKWFRLLQNGNLEKLWKIDVHLFNLLNFWVTSFRDISSHSHWLLTAAVDFHTLFSQTS